MISLWILSKEVSKMPKEFWFELKVIGSKDDFRFTACVKSKHLNGAIRKFYQTYGNAEIARII